MKIVVEICNFNDQKIKQALKGISRQDLLPNRVMIADGGSTTSYIEGIKAFQHSDPEVRKLNVEWISLPGTPLETREKSIDYLDEDITVFLDSDEVPEPDWLKNLTSPIINGIADFTGGPMISKVTGSNYITDYYLEIENRIYGSDVKVDVTYIPLGNTAWKKEILKKLRFDMKLAKSCGEAEDYDLEMRAVDSGYKGKFVPSASVSHYQSFPKTFAGLVSRRYQYLLGASIVMIKNGRLGKRVMEKRQKIDHPFAVLENLLKPIALLHGYFKWRLFNKINR